MTDEQAGVEGIPSSRIWLWRIVALVAIASFAYLLAARWASGYRLDRWRPWRDPFTVPLIQIALLFVLIVHVALRVWRRRLPLLPLVAILFILAGLLGLYQWSYELGNRRLNAEVTQQDIAGECLRLIHSTARDATGMLDWSHVSAAYPAIRRLNPEWVSCAQTTISGGAGTTQSAYVIVKLTPLVAYTFSYSESASSWVLQETCREGGAGRWLVSLPASTKPASGPEQPVNEGMRGI